MMDVQLEDIGALGSAFGGVFSFLTFAQNSTFSSNEPNENSEKYREAVHLVLEAARVTRAYLYDSQSLGMHDRAQERELSAAWMRASEVILDIDPSLSKVARVKSFGWAEPNRWQELRQHVSTIKIDDVIAQCNHLLGTRT
ncbi:hypothetical protein HYO34_23515 [Vibrio parahaemolyticus]|uniref:hypothetical protein n=2 Tax=Vibrio parahaemolyticus TaxID=670 RepID=UPI00193CB758|nr:hypothetical protein [Vibrio parahaemolyticus]EHW0650932.1 hypothetical protein [Vibrio parahaemolyticus]MBM4905619.1 hypothetical protein [Vibrio parahaemolyticus]MCG0031138.1 hypothetical protein [Vibrio parahaemolyticus]